jgi:TonB family protein
MKLCSITLEHRSSALRHGNGCKHFVAALLISSLVHTLVASSFTPARLRYVSRIVPPPYVSAHLNASLVVLREVTPAQESINAQDEGPMQPGQRRTAQPAKKVEPLPTDTSSAARGAVAPAPDLTYYPTAQLDVYPALSTALEFRTEAAAAGVTGRALILVLIDNLGVVEDVSVVEAVPAGYFEEDARRAFMAARFTPAFRAGRPVRSRVLVHIDYDAEAAR